MKFQDLFTPLALARGPPLKSRLLLAPLTNWQCNKDGTVTDDELRWLDSCARGGFSMVMTCAANVHSYGKAFPGQMGIYSDKHLEGLKRVASAIRKHGSVSSVQIHHDGARVERKIGGTPVGPSDMPSLGARGLSLSEVEGVRDDFIAAAKRAEFAGFDGVEIHGAFGWILTEFLSPAFNKRTDRYGGSLENRSRLLFEVIGGIRDACKPEFQIGLRLSMERYGVSLLEVREVAARAIREQEIDYLDLAVWDCKKMAQEAPFHGQTLLSVFTDLPRSAVRVGASGKIMSVRDALSVLEAGCDFVMLGKAAVLEPDFPSKAQKNEDHRAPSLPVSESFLKKQGLSHNFVNYMRTWEGFVSD